MKKLLNTSNKTKDSSTTARKLQPSYEDIQLINPKKEPLTPQFLKTFEGFQDISDEQAQSICVTSLLFAQILLETIARKNSITIDNQHVVCLREENKTPVVQMNTIISKPSKNKAA